MFRLLDVLKFDL